ncbi:Crp/Fnr family transcriptional regulator [[Clostridium] colinum]|uniref:Crp/Fnr family transcriptional regulator n=1 Tax=[Clostridium] colinum TaxID=36835 RepID=UPI0020254D44|nr:Crp/Fnr family transcriptional regulator [[Clostridium] colinum]
MEKYIPIIKKSRLFYNVSDDEIKNILKCLAVDVKTYKKGEYIYKVGDTINYLSLVVSGTVHIEKEDFWGNKNILIEICEGEVFGESYACINNEPISINAISSSNSKVILFDIKKAFNPSCPYCSFNTKLIQNLIIALATRNKTITEKFEHLSKRTIRNKLLSYLSEQSIKNKSSSFYIYFNRQQLADYLCVDRSAMSKELSKMRKEGLLNFNKNYFELNSSFNSTLN